MRKSFNKIKKLFKRSLIYRHGSVIAVESNAMLVIITIGRILQNHGSPPIVSGMMR